MTKGISHGEACDKAKSFVKQGYKVVMGLRTSKSEKRGKTWVIIVEGGFPRHRKFKIHVDAETGVVGFHKEEGSSL